MDVKLELTWMILSLQLIFTNCIPYTQQLGKVCSTAPTSTVTVSNATACKQTCDYNSQCKAVVYRSTTRQCDVHSSCPSPFTTSQDKDIYTKETVFQCDFEVDTCSLIQDTTDDFDWTRLSGSTGSRDTGPTGGQLGSLYYMYIEVSGGSTGYKARLITPAIQYIGTVCIQFGVHMYGATINELQVFKQTGSIYGTNVQVLTILQNEKGNEWRKSQVNVTLTSLEDRIGFTGIRGSSFTGDISIDNIVITKGSFGMCDTVDCGIFTPKNPGSAVTFTHTSLEGQATYTCTKLGTDRVAGDMVRTCQINNFWSGMEPTCAELLNANFETGKSPFLQDSTDQFNWYMGYGGKNNPDIVLEGHNNSIKYMYMSSSGRSVGQETRMLTNDLNYVGDVCVQFWLHIYETTSTFRVYTQNSTDFTTHSNILTVSGNQGNEWRKHQMVIKLNQTTDRVGFAGLASDSYTGDIGLDTMLITKAAFGFCNTVDCGMEQPYSSKVNITYGVSSAVGAMATYSCGTGHTFLSGDVNRVCQNNGHWSGAEILCGDLLECDSELTNCPFIHDSTDQFNWYKSSYPRILPDTTLTGQGGSSSYWYSSLLASHSDGSEGRIVTQSLRYAGQVCVQFWLHMFGNGINEFRVYRQTGVSYTSHVNVLTKTGSQGNEWRRIQLLVTLSNTNDKIGFTAVAGPSYVGVFAIDSLRITAAAHGLCDAPVDCGKEPPYNPSVNITFTDSSVGGTATYFCNEGQTFVAGNTNRVCQSNGYWSGSEIICGDLLECDSELTSCQFIQDSSDQFSWYKASYAKTLPYTTLTGQGGSSSYWYSSFSASHSNGSEGRIVTQSLKYSGQVCVQFWLHMYGDGINEFRVYRQNGVSYTSHVNVLTKTGSQGNEWRKIQLMVTTSSTFDKIGFTAVAGSTYAGLFAIDSLLITATANGLCPVDCGKEPPYSPNVNITFTDSSVGGVATYFCNEGQTFVAGNTNRVCQSDGYWSGSEILCGALLKCDFDYDTCVLTQYYTDRFNWYQTDRPRNAKLTQISGQNKTSKFWYASEAYRKIGDEARMTTSNLFYIGDVCIQLWLHMFGDMNEFRVYTQTGLDYNTHNDVLNITGSQGNEWRRIQATATLTSKNDRIGFTAVANSTHTGDFAIDSIFITAAFHGHCDTVDCGKEPSYSRTVTINYGNSSTVGAHAQYSCAPGLVYLRGELNRTCQSDGYWSGDVDAVTCGGLIFCDFENTSCQLTQEINDNFDWTRMNGPIYEGPTGIYNASNYYNYISTSGRMNRQARLISPELNFVGGMCLTFYHHMFGLSANKLVIYRQLGNSYDTRQDVVTIKRNHGNTWKKMVTLVKLTDTRERIGFSGYVGSYDTGYISIDDISMTNATKTGCDADIGNWTSWQDASPCNYSIWEKNQSRSCENGTCSGDVNRTAICYQHLSSTKDESNCSTHSTVRQSTSIANVSCGVSGLGEVRLVNHTIKNFTTPMVTSCVVKCRMDVQCYSVNYRTLKGDEGLCEVNSQAPTNMTVLQEYMVYHPKSYYYPIKQNIANG